MLPLFPSVKCIPLVFSLFILAFLKAQIMRCKGEIEEYPAFYASVLGWLCAIL
jgi:hypothetical protein